MRVVEREDLSLVAEWVNNLEFTGEFEPVSQESKTELEKQYDNLGSGEKWFLIEKKDGSRVGLITHFVPKGNLTGIGYYLAPSERGKGYGSEAVKMIVDYLFLSKDIVRIQAEIHPRNIASQKVLEKAGFRREGILRKCFFSRGVWRDTAMFSILREEWKEPKILTKT